MHTNQHKHLFFLLVCVAYMVDSMSHDLFHTFYTIVVGRSIWHLCMYVIP